MNEPPVDRPGVSGTAPPTTCADDEALGRWKAAALAAVVITLLAVPLSLLRAPHGPAPTDTGDARFVGSVACRSCHPQQYERWLGSDHERAMSVASEQTVLGDFSGTTFTQHGVTTRFFRDQGRFKVETEGPDGKPGIFDVAYTFGVRPLQQYLVPFPGGRVQCLTIAWDTVNRRWFSLYPDHRIAPDDWLHWTRNAQNWNGMCAECHSTNLVKGYDPVADRYQTTWSEISVGCEACHGPGSRHVEWAAIPPMARRPLAQAGLVVRTSGLSSLELVELCAPCHARRSEIGDYDHRGRRLLDHMVPALLTEGLYEADGQQQDEVYTYGSYLQSKMFARGIRCNDCHDSHRATLLKPGNAVCLQCHQQDVYDSPAHHFHKLTVAGRPSSGASCVACHMPERVYMGVDWRADHSLRRPRPDLTAEIGTPNACSQAACHADKPTGWAVSAYRAWYGLARVPHFGVTFAAARRGQASAAEPLRRLATDSLQSPMVRATALHYLAGYPSHATTAVVAAALTADDPLLRHVAATVDVEADPARRHAALAPLLNDPVKAVRMDAVVALAGDALDTMRPYQRDAYTAGLAEYQAAMAHALDFAGSAANLGNLYAKLGQPADAERYFRQALKIDTRFFPASLNLAVLLSGQGRLDDAERLTRAVIADWPANAEAKYALGLLLVERGHLQEAVLWLQHAADLEPRRGRIRYNLGLLLQQLGRLDDTTPILQSAVALEPDNDDFLLALGDHYLQRHQYADAAAVATRILAISPGHPAGRALREAATRGAAAPGR